MWRHVAVGPIWLHQQYAADHTSRTQSDDHTTGARMLLNRHLATMLFGSDVRLQSCVAYLHWSRCSALQHTGTRSRELPPAYPSSRRRSSRGQRHQNETEALGESDST